MSLTEKYESRQEKPRISETFHLFEGPVLGYVMLGEPEGGLHRTAPCFPSTFPYNYATVNYSILHNYEVHNVCRSRGGACKARFPL